MNQEQMLVPEVAQLIGLPDLCNWQGHAAAVVPSLTVMRFEVARVIL